MRRPLPVLSTLTEGIRSGNRQILAQAITLVESTLPEHQALAEATIAALLAEHSGGASLRIGITGAPGVGKSSLIEALGMYLVGTGRRVAVLAVDPSSSLSKGSILGDKTRMEQLSVHPLAFIRPSPAGDSLGGVARKTRETILLVEAAGYDTVIVETVGVGQSEVAVHSMTDVFLLLLLPGAGDDLQGIKRGIVEMADLLVVNKSDGERVPMAQQARMHYSNAIHLLPSKASGWSPTVLAASATENRGIGELWVQIERYRAMTRDNGFFEKNRQQQAKFWLHEALDMGLKRLFEQHAGAADLLKKLAAEVEAGRISPFAAADQILRIFQP